MFKGWFDETYRQHMSRADYWVLVAQLVVEIHSVVDDPSILFRYGLPDSNNCPSSSSRLPVSSGCTDVEDLFINRLGLNWTDTVTLMGGHTMRCGSEDLSGQEGSWVDTPKDTTTFDNKYYDKLMECGWFPRETDVGTDWTRGNEMILPKLMLNSDICLAFDIPDGDEQTCCTRLEDYSCVNFRVGCETSDEVRNVAHKAVKTFKEDETEFYHAFWKLGSRQLKMVLIISKKY